MSNTISTSNISIGTPATYCIGSDRYGGSIIEVKRNGRTLVFKKTNGYGEPMEFTKRKVGPYREKGIDCGYLRVGVAEDYMDPSF